MHDRCTRLLGDTKCILEAEEFTLTVNDIRRPLYDFFYQMMTVREWHAHLGIYNSDGHGSYVVNVSVAVTVYGLRQREDPDIVAHTFQFFPEILYRCYDTVYGACKEI